MVESTRQETQDTLDLMSEEELLKEIAEKDSNSARLTLARHFLEGTHDKIAKNVEKGREILREAAKKEYLPAIEYKIYWDIRNKERPNLEKIQKNLEFCGTEGKSARACNTLAEIYMGKGES